MPITTINPEGAYNPERNDRSTLGKEILKDEAIILAVSNGSKRYASLLGNASAEARGQFGEKDDPAKTTKKLELLANIVQSGLYNDLLKKAESMKTTLRGAKEARVILGHTEVGSETPVFQLELRARTETSSSIRENEMSASYKGISPEAILIERSSNSLTPITFTATIKEVIYSPDDEGIKVIDSAGLSMDITAKGQINEIRGVTYKHGAIHFSESLLPPDRETGISDLQLSAQTLSSISDFVK